MLTVLLAGVIGLVLVAAIASTALTGLQLGTRQSNVENARNAAESVLALGVEQLLSNHRFGQKDQVGFLQILEWRARVGPEALGRLTFHPDLAAAEGLPRSTNNFDSDIPTEGDGDRVVAPDTVHLVALGECRGANSRVELFLYIPPYPYVVSCSGAFRSQGSVLVGQVPEPGAVTGLEPDSLRPGHLLSNHSDKDAVRLGGTSLVKGDVRTAGGAEIGDEARVEGRILEGQEPFPIPTLRLADYDPAERPGLVTLTDSRLEAAELSGYNRREGGLVLEGGLKLDNGVLFVDGDLTVDGGLEGRGALIVTGTTTIRDGAALQTDNQVALLSGGSVNLQGNGQASSFRGLVYTEGDLRANEVTLVGAFVANGEKSGAAGGIELRDARLLQDPAAQKIQFQVGLGAPVAYEFSTYDPPGSTVYYRPGPGPRGYSNNVSSWRMTYDPETGRMAIDWWDPLRRGPWQELGSITVSQTPGNQEVQRLMEQTATNPLTVATPDGGRRPAGSINNLLVPMEEGARTQLIADFLGQVAAPAAPVDPSAPPPGEFSLDFNQFLKVEDRIRILLWK